MTNAVLLLLQGASDFQQAARLGPDGLVLGPNKAGDLKDRTLSPYDPTIDMRLQNVKLGPDGLQINAGSKTNSTVQVLLTPGLAGRAYAEQHDFMLRYVVSTHQACMHRGACVLFYSLVYLSQRDTCM